MVFFQFEKMSWIMRLLHNKTNAWLNVMELVHTLKMVKLFSLLMLEMEFRALCLLGKYCAIEQGPYLKY